MGCKYEYWCDMCGGKPDTDKVEVRFYDDFPDKCWRPDLCLKCYRKLKEVVKKWKYQSQSQKLGKA